VVDATEKLALVKPAAKKTTATRCAAQLTFASGPSILTVDHVVPLDGASPLDDPDDATEQIEATVVGDYWPPAKPGTACEIRYNATEQRWELARLDGAWRCNAQLVAVYPKTLGYESGDATVTVDHVVGLDGEEGVLSETDQLTATVYFDHWPDTEDGAKCKIEWNAPEKRWELYQLDCEAPA
jgi:hypothetical protein